MRNCVRAKTKGFVAVLILISFIMGLGGYSMLKLLEVDARLQEREKTQLALQAAKRALLDYVATGNGLEDLVNFFDIRAGRLPCPNQDGNGVINPGVGVGACEAADTMVIGLFPYQSLGLVAPRDGQASCLWLVIDGRVKNAGAAGVMNAVNADYNGLIDVVQPYLQDPTTDTWGERALTGAGGQSAVALIMSSGSARGDQNRANTGGAKICEFPGAVASAAAGQFFETYTSPTLTTDNFTMPAAGLSKRFVQADIGQEKLNDQMIWITSDEYAAAVSRLAMRQVAAAINNFVYGNAIQSALDFGNGFYPPAAAVPGGDCVTGRLQGYVPGFCDSTNTTGGSLNGLTDFNLGARMTPAPGGTATNRDPERWLSQMHYSVSPDCLRQTASVAPVTAVINPCQGTGGVRISVDGNNQSTHAVLLIRGKDPSGGVNCFTVAPNTPGLTPALAPCIDDAVNQAAVRNANQIALLPYVTPASTSRNLITIFKDR